MTDLLIRGCTLWDGTPGSVYCSDGRIARIYRDEDPDLSPGAETVEANGGSLQPGFADTHCHPYGYGLLKRSVDLRGASNVTAMRMRLSARVVRARPDEWILGMGWDQEAFPDRRMPSRADIDDVSPSNPVALSRVCGHIGLLNTAAVRLLGLETKGGIEYERDVTGQLTGIVKEGALGDALSRIPRTVDLLASDLQSVEAEGGKFGLTSLHCILSPEGFREELSALAVLGSNGSLGLRYRVYAPFDALEYIKEKGLMTKMRGDLLRFNGVKVFTDGSLGARTAALREPYSDEPGNQGMLLMKDEELADLVDKIDTMGHQAIIHAIGDRAVEQAIDALSRVTGNKNPRRHRIEHASLVPRDLRGKMAHHGIRAAVQPSFVASDTWAVGRLGEERVRDLYPFRSMIEEGIVLSGGSDCPVESLNPVLGIWSAMTRGGSTPEEGLTLEQGLALYTANAASNGFDEVSLREGGPADFTLFDSNITGMHPALLRKVGVLATVVAGSPVHSFGGG